MEWSRLRVITSKLRFLNLNWVENLWDFVDKINWGFPCKIGLDLVFFYKHLAKLNSTEWKPWRTVDSIKGVSVTRGLFYRAWVHKKLVIGFIWVKALKNDDVYQVSNGNWMIIQSSWVTWSSLRSREEKKIWSTSNIEFEGLHCYFFSCITFCKRLCKLSQFPFGIGKRRTHSEVDWRTA